MTTVAQLTIEMAANVARLTTDMAAARRTVDNTFGAISKDVAKLKTLLGGVFAGFGAQQTLGKLITVQREFDVLNSSLITVTGSSTMAEQQMRWIKEFAATTPYQLSEVTGAFVKMKAMGLDASQAALESYGNTASAMGKGLNQMIEAVADAATGEFERLKEFGIRSRKEGDNIAFTFQGVTTRVGNNAQEITAYLQQLGNVNFGGAMERRAQTLDGAISNLADSWDELFRTVSSNNVGGLIYDSVRLANGVLSDAVTILQAMAGAQNTAAGGTGALVSAQSALATVFETVAVLGANVKYVLVQTGTELGGLAAQAVQILQGNFAGAAAIRQMMVADSQAARREVDATTSRILNARRLAGVAATGAGMDEPRFARLLSGGGAAASAASGGGGARAAASKAAAAAKREEADALRKVIELAEHRNRLFDEEFQKEEAARMVVEGRIRSAREMLEAIEQETRLMGLSGLEREKAVALLELERKGVEKGTEAYERLAPAILAAIEARSARAAGLMTVDEIIEEAARTAKTVGNNTSNTLADSISQGILEGARNGSNIMQIFKRELEAQFARTILRPMIQPVADGLNSLISTGLNALMGAFGGGAASSGYNPGASMGFSTNWEQYMPSYAGGGHTGNGARSGGLDGQGGFMAMLHPRERVVDETQSSGNVILNVITPPGQAMEARQSSRTSEDGTRIVELVLSAVGDSLANRSGAPARGLEAGYGLRPSMA
jgi:hypothetical protein